MACLFIEIYQSVGEGFKIVLYWRVLNCNFEDISNYYNLSNMFSP